METNTIYNSLQILLYRYLDKEQEEREKLKITAKEPANHSLISLHISLELFSAPDHFSRSTMIGHSIEHRELQWFNVTSSVLAGAPMAA